jgi:hypothetical protein
MIYWVFFLSLFLGIAFPVNGEHKSTLEEKVRFLQESIMKRPTINLNLDRWKAYVQSSPRNYSIVVMLTVLSSNMNCPICKWVKYIISLGMDITSFRPAYDEFTILANSYRYTHLHSKALYFAVVDYEEAPQIFNQVRNFFKWIVDFGYLCISNACLFLLVVITDSIIGSIQNLLNDNHMNTKKNKHANEPKPTKSCTVVRPKYRIPLHARIIFS